MPPRLIFAFALSFALHGMLLYPGLLKRLVAAPSRPVLQATLRLQPKPAEPSPFDPTLKNTLDAEEAKPVSIFPPPKSKPAGRVAVRREVLAAQRKLSKHLFYPAEAVEQGIEGEVRLIVKLSADGLVENVSVAASSGHPVLDHAAIRAAYARGSLRGSTSRELILPVIFRLQ